MKKSLFQKVICFVLSATILLGVFAITASADSSYDRGYSSNRDTASSLEDMKALVGISSYQQYLAEYGEPSVEEGMETVKVDVTNPISKEYAEIVADSLLCQNAMKENPEDWFSFGNNQEGSLYISDKGEVTWNFRIDVAGYYYIKLDYFSCITAESSISTIERKLYIDGMVPFDEASYISLSKTWGYTNIITADPVPTDEPDGATTVYEQKSDGYYKISTVIKDGMKTVTTYVLSQDINGNSMAPSITPSPSWSTYYCQDKSGYYQGYFRFYLASGNHQITLAAVREPVIIKGIELVPYDPALNAIPSYESVKQMYADKGYQSADGEITNIQAEFPDFVSDSSVYPSNDKTSSATYPSVSKAQLHNVIGKNSYDALGQWAAYKFSVDKTGLYKLNMRYQQSTLQGMYLCRTLKLQGGMYSDADGMPTVPFMEAYDTQFPYSKDWQSSFAGDSNGNIFEFYFEAGVEYTLYIECSLGSLNNLVQSVENTLNVLNDCYLRILQLTGSAPDEYRDYGFLEIMPDVLISFGEQAMELERIRLELKNLCGTNGSHISTLGTVALLLDDMSRNDGYNIASNLSTLKAYLGTLGTWVNDSKKGKLILDSISVCPSDTSRSDLPSAKAGFFKSIWFEITSFFYSFITDYDKMGVTEINSDNDVSIDVWLAMGRDQSNIWRRMVDAQDGFTDRTGYAVNLKLVTASTLLPSVLAGKGPDVYMGLPAATVINYAIRDAILGVSGNYGGENFDNTAFNTTIYTYKSENGIEKTTEYKGKDGLSFVSLPYKQYAEENFVPAAIDTLTLLDVSYGLPQTMTFSMMFYRMDILAQLGQEVPETWDDLLSMLPVLQSNNMQFGIDYIGMLDYMLYQKGGGMWKYDEDPALVEYAGSKVDLDSDVALEAFDFVCRLYSDYSFPVSYDAANRFRTGEMPVLVGGYTALYNQLVVYATEIEGKWEFCPLPGCATYDDKGNRTYINYDSIASVGASVILYGCEGEQRNAAWEFMQWHTSADIQSSYGNQMVSILGPSAKYETGNINAIQDLSWTASEKDAILDQIEHMSSIVNYPGSYYIARYIKFAFLDAVNEGADPVDALNGYIDAINAEITRKREEFGLKTGDPS